MKKILIVDDDNNILNFLKDSLDTLDFEILLASNGESAKNIIPLEKPDLVITDVKMPKLNGIELLHFCKREDEPIPVIIMTGYIELIKKHEAIELGAREFIQKPFKIESVIEAISDIFEMNRYIPKYKDEDFCQIDISRFISSSRIPCSLYIRLRENKYVKLAHKGDFIPKSDINKYKGKGLKYISITKDEFRNFVDLNIKLSQIIAKKKKQISKPKLSNFIISSSEAIIEDAFIMGMDREHFQEVSEYSKIVLEILANDEGISSLLESICTHDDSLYSHSLTTALYAVMIAQEIGWHSEPIIFKVFMAGLLHDIGFKNIDESLVTKNPALFNLEDIKNYESHPIRGMEVLNAIGNIPEEVILVAYQHHENCLGTGFPLGLKKNNIMPISRLIAVADIIKDFAVSAKNTSKANYIEAYNTIINLKSKYYDVQMLKAFGRVLGIEPKKDV